MIKHSEWSWAPVCVQIIFPYQNFIEGKGSGVGGAFQDRLAVVNSELIYHAEDQLLGTAKFAKPCWKSHS